MIMLMFEYKVMHFPKSMLTSRSFSSDRRLHGKEVMNLRIMPEHDLKIVRSGILHLFKQRRKLSGSLTLEIGVDNDRHRGRSCAAYMVLTAYFR